MTGPDPRIGQTIDDRYRILERMPGGAMSVVYRAWDEKLKREVALKILLPGTLEDQERTEREAQALARPNHPSVAAVYDFRTKTPQGDYIAMEFVAGESLDRILARGPLAEPEAVRLGIMLAAGLEATHKKGVLHRDLKPANLRVDREGQLKIVDFGLAKRVPASTESSALLDPNAPELVGTPHYVAPEMWDGAPASEATDLYAAGVVLYEMATGLRPFHDLPQGRFVQSVLSVAPPSPRQRNPAVSREFEAIILRCMEKSPVRRLASARELERALRTNESRLEPTPAPIQAPRRFSLRWWTLAAAALILAAGVGAIGLARGWWPGGSSAPKIRSLAVQPLVNLSGDAGQEYMAQGMTEQLTSNLTETPKLHVISYPTVKAYDWGNKTLPQAARELGVDGIVMGTMWMSADHVRFSMKLFYGPGDLQLWHKDYDGDRRDAPDIQSRVARKIAREIGLELGEGSPKGLGRPRINKAAQEDYLLGRYHWNLRSQQGVQMAIHDFESAIRRDSLYAPAFSGLADAWAAAGIGGWIRPTEAYPHAKQAALRALALDSTQSEGYVSLGNILQNFEWDWTGAARAYRRAIALNDNNAQAHHWYANHLALRGDFGPAMAEVRRALELDPLSLPIGVGAGAFLYYARRYDEALVEYRRVARRDSTSGLLNRAMAASYLQLGREADAARAVQRWLDQDYPGPPAATAARAYHRGGFPAMTRVLIAALEAKRNAGQYEPATHLAELYALLHDREHALHWLSVAYDEHDTQINRLRVDPIFDPLRQDPRFEELMRMIGLAPGQDVSPS